MPSTFFGLNIGTTGLYTYQTALNTTSHNIANAETEGYSRQVALQKAGTALRVNSSYGMVGSGVDVTGIERVRNFYYDQKYWTNNTTYGEYSSKADYAVKIQSYLNEVKMQGFTVSFNSFNESLQQLKNNPSDKSVRTQVSSYGQSLAEYFNSLSTNLQNIQEECNFEIKNQVDRINSIGKQIAVLTKQISTIEVNGGIANDLRDERALLEDELSQFINISVSEEKVGAGVGVYSYTVKINNQVLVDSHESAELKVVPRKDKINQNDIIGLYDVEWTNGQSFRVQSPTIGGSLQALFAVRDGNNGENLRGQVTGTAGDTKITLEGTNINEIEKLNIPYSGIITIDNTEYNYSSFTAIPHITTDPATGAVKKTYTYEFTLDKGLMANVSGKPAKVGESIDYKGIPYYMGQLNEFIRTYSKSFNDIHKSGEDLNGDAGTDFFTGGKYVKEFANAEEYYFLTAANFSVSDVIYNNPDKIVTANEVTNGVEKTNILDSLIALKNDKGMFKQGAPASFLQTMVADIGIDTKAAESFSKSQKDILSMINNQRLSISGVDVDEEAMNLVRYQNAYNLSAQVISVMNEIYDKLINQMGV